MDANKLKHQLYGRFAPFLVWFPELVNKAVLRADIVAGITVALVLIPQSMAYASLAGLPPEYGLYAALLPPFVAALFGSSRQLATGPVAMVSLMTAVAIATVATGNPENLIPYAILLAFLVGIFQVVLGILKLGVLVNFLSHPVVIGFTNAAAIIIATSQLAKIFGVTIDKSKPDEEHFMVVWKTIVTAVQHIHWPTFFIAIFALAIMLIIKRFRPKFPYVLIAVVVTTLFSWLVDFHSEKYISFEKIADKTVQKHLSTYFDEKTRIKNLKSKVIALQSRYDTEIAQKGIYSRDSQNFKNDLDILKPEVIQLKKANHHLLTKTIKNLRLGHTPKSLLLDEMYYDESKQAIQGTLVSTGWRLDHKHLMGEKGNKSSIRLVSGGAIVGTIKSEFPSFSLPQFEWSAIVNLATWAIIISLIGFVEALSIAKAMASQTRQRLDANQELIGQGLANLSGSLFQSYPVSGSFSRSAINFGAGAVTGFSSIVTSITVAFALLFLTPLLFYLPQATLAAVIMIAVIGLVNLKAIKHAWLANRDDGLVAVVTFILTLALAPHLEKGLLIGIALSLILFLLRTMKPRVVYVSKHADGTMRDAKAFNLQTCNEISVLRFEGSLYFANTSYLEDMVQKALTYKSDLKFLVIDAVSINQIDATGEEMLRELSKRMEEQNICLIFTRFKKPILDTLEKTGFISLHGREFFFRKQELAFEFAWEKLEENHKDTCPLNNTMPVRAK